MGQVISGAQKQYGATQLKFLNDEIEELALGHTVEGTPRFAVMLAAFRALATCPNFYKLEVPILCRYLDALGPMKIKEVRTVVAGVLRFATTSKEDAIMKLTSVLIAMRVLVSKNKQICVSPSVDPNIYKKVLKGPFETPWKSDWPGPSHSLFDFTSAATIAERKRQEKEDRSNMPDPVHTREAAHVVVNNDVFMIWKYGGQVKPRKMDKRPARPISWEANITKSVEKDEVKSFLYNMWLLPELINLPSQGKLDTLAHTAVRHSREEIISLLSQLGCDFHRTNSEGLLPIHLAVKEEIVTALVNAGCDINARTTTGENLLEIRSKAWDKAVIERLLQLGANILEPNPKGAYWMQWVIHNKFYGSLGYDGFQNMVRYIVRDNTTAVYNNNEIYKEIIMKDIGACAQTDAADFHASVTQRNIPRIHVLVALGVLIDARRERGLTNLMLCAENGDLEIANILVRNFADTNLKNEYGENLFRIAARFGHWDLARLVKRYKSDINALANDGMTVLHMSYAHNLQELFMFCLNERCSPNVRDAQGLSVQFIAFLKRDDATAEMIQDKYQGDINLQDNDCNTLGHLAVQQRDETRVEYLLSRGLGLEIKNKMERTMFMEAVVASYLDICDLLLRYGADINTCDGFGNTSLLLTCLAEAFNRYTFDFLMERGCDVNIRNHERNCALSVLIARQLDDEAGIVFNRPEVQITDRESLFEPIVVALQRGSQQWFESLVYRGADAQNKHFPVVTTYLQCPFYSLEMLKRIPACNLILGSPIPVAMNLDMQETVMYLWSIANDPTRVKVSETKDAEGRIPLTIAILKNWEAMVLELMKPEYECGAQDKTGTTPLMYCAKMRIRGWAIQIYSLVGAANAGLVDSQGCSALTFSAINGWTDVCDQMFIDGVSLKCERDRNGIIDRYVALIDKLKSCIAAVDRDIQSIQNCLDSWISRVRDINRRIESCLDTIRNIERRMGSETNPPTPHDMDTIRQRQQDIARHQRALGECESYMAQVRQVLARSTGRRDRLCGMTRADLLRDINVCVRIANDNDDIRYLRQASTYF